MPGTFVGETVNAVFQSLRLANKFIPTEDGVGFCRSQRVGEPVDAVGQSWQLANRFAPTVSSLGRFLIQPVGFEQVGQILARFQR
jgi:hypothetical protein